VSYLTATLFWFNWNLQRILKNNPLAFYCSCDKRTLWNKFKIQYNIFFLGEDVAQLSERVKQLEETILEQKKIIESCKKENQTLTSKKHATAIVSNELQKYFSPSQAKSIMTQKRVNWSEEDIVKGLMLRSLSRKSYQFIRKKNCFQSHQFQP